MKIIINAREKEVDAIVLFYSHIVLLAFPHMIRKDYTVTYSSKTKNGISYGTMVDGDKIILEPGMIFNIGLTNNA